ncbi:MAG: FKBP-type peptidyl-prolyl cis-trans isomerase [Sediminibacterium sp.]
MQVEKNKVVGIHYTISIDEQGEVFSNINFEPEEYVHGAIAIFPMVANALEGHKVNEEVNITLSPQQAYGIVNEKLIKTFPISLFENINEVELGSFIQIPGGAEAKLLQKNIDTILVDANHPLAGAFLHYKIKIVTIRQANELEIQRGLTEAVIKSCDGSPNCC